jgi:hypothetical protein
MTLSIRAALWIISGFLGALWTIFGLFSSLSDCGIGLVVMAASLLGWGFMDWMER